MKPLFSISYILLLVFSACETEVDPCDKWQNIPVIYGIIDPDDSVHYIRINKAFLGNLNAYTMAQESDSITYDPTMQIDVRVHAMTTNNRIIKTLEFEKRFIRKDSVNLYGQTIFGIQNHHVYVSNDTFSYGNVQKYHLEIRFSSGIIVTSTTPHVHNFRHFYPTFINEIEITNRANNSKEIQYFMPNALGSAKIEMRFYYYEVTVDGRIAKKKVVFGDYLYRIFPLEYNPNLQMIKIFDRQIVQRFRKMLDSTDSNVLARYLGKIDIRYHVSNSDLTDLLFYRSSTLNSDIISPSNIKGGMGIFASRRHLNINGFRNSEVSYETFFVHLPNHKFQPRGAYPEFLQNLPDSLQ
jgi:hypothetical protein